MLLILCVMTVAFAGLIQGLSCFGFALISVPILAKVLPLQMVVPIVVCLSLATNFAILKDCWREVNLRAIWLLVVASLLATPLGAYLLLCVDAGTLKLAVGVLVLSFAVLQLQGRCFPIRRQRFAHVAVGALSGVLNSSISMSGPPVALFLSNQGASKEQFRADITGYAVILNLVTLATHFAGGLLSASFLAHVVWLIPCTLLGVWAGKRLARHINEHRFRLFVLGLIMAGACWTIYNALPGVLG